MTHTMNTTYRCKKQVTSLMARCTQGVAKVYPRCSQALGKLMSMLRVWLEAAWSMARVWLEYAYSIFITRFLRPFSSKRAELERRLVVSLFLLLVLGSTSVWGQDYSGTYYFVNCGSGKDGTNNNPLDPKIEGITNADDYFYLVPADNPQQGNKRDAWFSSNYSTANGDPEKPYLTTYRTKKDAADVPEGVTSPLHNSVWILQAVTNEAGVYYIIHAATGKYVVYEPPYSSKNNRKSVHLLATDSPGENAKFAITTADPTRSEYFNFRVKELQSGNRFLNPTHANYPFYYCKDGSSDGDANYFRGLIGLYLNKKNDNKTDASASDWKPEPVTFSEQPTISDVSEETNKVTVTGPAWLPEGYTIRYTFSTEGEPEDPTATSDKMTNGEYPVTAAGTLKVVVERYGVLLSAVATKSVEPAQCKTPVFTYSTGNISITSGTPNAIIYYTLDETDPASSSTRNQYIVPFELADQQTLKAIATNTGSGFRNSEIASVKAVLNPTITLAQTVYTYDGSAKEPAVSSVMDGETPIATSKYNVTYSNNTNASTATVNIEDIAGDDLIVYGSANFTINPKAVTITANDASKAYNGIALTESGFTTTPLETGDTHTFTVVMTEGSTITNIGTEPNVIATVDGTAVTTGTETAIGNYLVTTANGTLTVNPKAVTITAKNASKAYDGTALTESGFTNTALETDDTHTFTVVMTEGSTITNIGTKPNVIATVDGTAVTTGTETAIGNYLVTTANGTLTITPKPLTITAGSDTKVYDSTPLTKNSYTHTELLTGDKIEGVTVTGSQTNAGTSDNVLSAAVIKNSNDDDVTANYHITYTNGTLKVTPKPITVKADNKWKAYGEADPRLTYTSGGLLNNDAITGTLSRVAGEDVGTYAITVGGLTAGDNYEISFTGANLTIVKAELTVTANNHIITYGDAPAGNGVTCEGFVGEETSAVLGGTLAYDFSYTQYGDVGNTYTIKPKGLTSSNYEITFSTGKLTVNPKEVGLTWSETTSFPYDGSPHAPTATATGLVNGDKIGVTVSGAETNAGNSHTATASALTGTKKHNYKLPEANTQSFTITPKSIGDGTTLADGYTLNFGENNTILLTDDVIGSALVPSTDYSVGEDTDTNEGYSERNVTGKGNYTGSFTVRNASVAFSTDTEQDRWSGTFVAEKKNEGDIGFALPEGFTAFIISDIQGEWAIPEPLNYIPADVPVLLVANHQTQGFVVTEAESEKVTAITPDQKDKNMLEKVTEATSGYDPDTQSAPFGTKQIYLLYKNEFVFNKAGNLKKGKVYLNPNHTASSPEPAPARLMIAWNHTTGIEDGRGKIEDGSSERWYTLDGRCLSGKPTTKGLYIVNGKKTVIK